MPGGDILAGDISKSERYKTMGGQYTEAQARAFSEYEARTFKKSMFRFRLDTDMDIIDSIEDAKANGISKNEWLRELFDGRGISLKDVERVLEKYGVDPRIAEKMLKELSGK